MPDEVLTERIVREINLSGFPLELDVVARFASAAWMVSPNLIFRDLAGALHELDVWAVTVAFDAPLQLGRLATVALVECKRSRDKPWVFFTQEHAPYGEEYRAGSALLSDWCLADGRSISSADENCRFHHHYTDRTLSVARTYFEAFKEHRKDGDIFAAVTTLLHARAFAQRWFEEVGGGMLRSFLLHPIIVFEGKLFVAHRTQDGNWSATQTDHVLLRTIDCIGSSTTQPLIPSNDVTIDVVTPALLEQFMARSRTDMGDLQRWISEMGARGELVARVR